MSEDEAAARTLFNDGRQLLKKGRYEEACAKFEAAKALSRSAGVLLNLADCHEHLNLTASAWTEFGDAADAAAEAGRTADQAEAKRRQAALQDKLSLLTISVNEPAEDEVIKRDGATIERAAWGSGIPVDPGSHTITAEASGRTLWSQSVNVSGAGQTSTVRVPRLELTPRVAAPSPAIAAPNLLEAPESNTQDSGTGQSQRVAGWVIGGIGVAAVATSGIVGLVAKSHFKTAEGEAGAQRHQDSTRACSLADVGTVLLIAGGATAMTGLVLWLSAPKTQLAVGLSGPGLFVAGALP